MKYGYLDERLKQYADSDVYPFHMPGHKRRPMEIGLPERIDITEISGFDNLHHAEGILREAQQRMAELAGAEESFFLVNGSTAGILAAVCASVRRGGCLITARNSHKALYHALELKELEPVYLYPDLTEYGIQGSILPDQVEKVFSEHPDASAVFLTSPTYDGVVSDIRSISRIAHEHGALLIVDEAHGAHFGFWGKFPRKALEYGADIVIESLHKTLPSFTQTAVLHIQGNLVSGKSIRKYLDIFQSSSPSYIFMAGMDRCTRVLKTQGRQLFEKFDRRLDRFYTKTADLKRLSVLPEKNGAGGIFMRDRSKILISDRTAGISGEQLLELFRDRYGIEMEMASGQYVTALTSICDTDEGFDRLIAALYSLDEFLLTKEPVQADHTDAEKVRLLSDGHLYRPVKKRMNLTEADEAEGETVALTQAAGRISKEFIYLYPPGIPLIVPGEMIEKELIQNLADLKREGFSIQGLSDYSSELIDVVI